MANIGSEEDKKFSLAESDYKRKMDSGVDSKNIFGSDDENDSDYIKRINKEVENTLTPVRQSQ